MQTQSKVRSGTESPSLLRHLALVPALLLLLLAGLPATAAAKYASIVIDAQTGQVLHAASADTRNFPASLTKMMTLYMTFEALDDGKLSLNQRLPVSARAAGMAPSKLGLKAGERVAVEDCILGLVTKSANDCAVVLAEALGGSEVNFAKMMTAKARSMGMTRTTFKNASGLPNAGQLSTARDMARLAQALLQDHPKHYGYFSTRSFTFRGVTHNNHNRLMARYDGMDGLKTGFIRASGFNLAASAVRDGRRLIAVVFGGQSAVWRDNHLASLMDRAFDGRATPLLMAEAPVRSPAGRSGRAVAPVPDRKPGGETRGETGVVSAVAQAAGELSLVSAAVAATPAAGLPKAAAPSGWGIQVGAFNDKASSQRAVALATQRAGSILDKAVPHIVAVPTDRGATLFRARLVGLDEKTARRACAALSKAGQGCLTVPPARGT